MKPGSDGHTLALAADGSVFSWGDGDYGKLGHGSSLTQKVPKLIEGPLARRVSDILAYCVFYGCTDVYLYRQNIYLCLFK